MVRVNMTRILGAFDEMIESNGSDVNVTLSSGETGTIRMGDVGRQNDNLTSGVSQETEVVRCMGLRWDAAFPRPPRKGDVLEILGHKYGVNEVKPARFQGVTVGYVMRVKG